MAIGKIEPIISSEKHKGAMCKKLIDTTTFIDRSKAPALHKNLFFSEELFYLSCLTFIHKRSEFQ